MSKTEIIFGILMFAAAAAILYVWGLKKSENSREDLNRRLKSVCGVKIVKYLKKNEAITKAHAGKLIQGMSAGPAWSRHRVKVQNGNAFVSEVLEFLKEQHYITEDGGVYKIKER